MYTLPALRDRPEIQARQEFVQFLDRLIAGENVTVFDTMFYFGALAALFVEVSTELDKLKRTT